MPRLKSPQRREQLKAVATRLFAEKGFDATTTAGIAQAAGVTEPILYRHFSGKQELFVQIIREVAHSSVQGWMELVKGVDDPAEKLRLITAAYPQEMTRRADVYSVIHGALAISRDPLVLGVLREYFKQIETFFMDIFRDGQKRGIFHAEANLQAAVWLMIHTGLGYTMIHLHLPGFEQFPIQQAMEYILCGVGSGGASAPPTTKTGTLSNM